MSSYALAKGTALPAVSPECMRIYSMRFCPYAQRTRMILNYKNIPHEVVNVNLKKKPKWLWERNPSGLVPVLEYRGQVVYESAICDDYLDVLFPDPPLRSRCPVTDIKDRLLMADFDKTVPCFYKVNDQNEKEQRRAREQINRMFSVLERTIVVNKYFGGVSPNMLDFHFFPWFERLPVIKKLSQYDCLPQDNFPRLSLWSKTMSELPAVKSTLLPEDWHAEFMIKLAMKEPEYDIGLPDQTEQAKL